MSNSDHYFTLELSNQELLFCLLVGSGIFLVFRVLGAKFITSPKLAWLKRMMPALEGVAWLSYLGWIVHQIGGGTLDYLASLTFVILVVAFVVWFALRDFVAGIIIKFDGLYTVGDQVHIGPIHGTLSLMGFRAMRIVLPNGEEASLPYSRVLGKPHSRKPQGQLTYQKNIEISLTSELPLEQLLYELKQSLCDAPWWVPSKLAHVEVKKWQKGTAVLNIQVHALSDNDFLKIVNYACQQFGDFKVKEGPI